MFKGTSQVDIWEKNIPGRGNCKSNFQRWEQPGEPREQQGGQHIWSGLSNGERQLKVRTGLTRGQMVQGFVGHGEDLCFYLK